MHVFRPFFGSVNHAGHSETNLGGTKNLASRSTRCGPHARCRGWRLTTCMASWSRYLLAASCAVHRPSEKYAARAPAPKLPVRACRHLIACLVHRVVLRSQVNVNVGAHGGMALVARSAAFGGAHRSVLIWLHSKCKCARPFAVLLVGPFCATGVLVGAVVLPAGGRVREGGPPALRGRMRLAMPEDRSARGVHELMFVCVRDPRSRSRHKSAR